MRIFLLVISYIFHPLFTPIGGTVAYFILTPKFTPPELKYGNLLPIFILTVIIPVIAYFILRNLGVVSTVFVPNLKERKYPLYINLLILFLVVYKVIGSYFIVELHFFFIGLIIATMTTLLLLFFKLKASIHLMGMGSIYMFLVCLSIHFEINITLGLSLLTIATGLVATSRIYLKAHTKPELVIGLFIGLLSQLITIQYWL
ncbi:hypothetical protein [Cytophaga sp. FL35]|uniref:hypothetical protein n=1 Tax=Cytophaga sp. FL35 TaxID=1904456 RepID=UPI001653C000|nr:hypothetical protein [Cytophaga sp. FL35]MBC6997184.1 hypothetical protein [Cytophaga sp. FL35]